VAAPIIERVVRRVDVVGPSMAPTLMPGQRVTVLRRWRRLRPGDVVVVDDPSDPTRLLIKRVVTVRGHNVEVRGDNAAVSTDSRDFGDVDSSTVRWIVVRSSMKSTR
jgi:nickel-type superoxide dismutase maturation protease